MKLSAGILAYRHSDGAIEVLIAHPGGPFWAKRDEGVWSIPKGEVEDGEDFLLAARREFSEELGVASPDGPYVELGAITQKAGKATSFKGRAPRPPNVTTLARSSTTGSLSAPRVRESSP